MKKVLLFLLILVLAVTIIACEEENVQNSTQITDKPISTEEITKMPTEKPTKSPTEEITESPTKSPAKESVVDQTKVKTLD